jgi:DNA-binding PadR family transcriptional regulator
MSDISLLDIKRHHMTSQSEQIPLSPATFHILLAIAAGSTHGYAIMQEVERLSDGRVKLAPGTLYASIKRLLREKLIVEVDAPPDETDTRRRYYELTAQGRSLAQEEARRLSLLVQIAQQRQLLGHA